MDELIKMSTDIHIFFVFLTLVIAVVNFYIVKYYDEYIRMTKKYELFTLLYYLSISVVVFTGLVVLAVYKFEIRLMVYLMMLTSVFIIIPSFKTHKLFKKTRLKNKETQMVFRAFATRKFAIDILLILFTAILAFLFRI